MQNKPYRPVIVLALAVVCVLIPARALLAQVRETVTAEQKAEYTRQFEEKLADPQFYKERYRPQFHFTPLFNWTNDPNGLVYYQGEYHLFFQHNPFGREWGNMSWAHAVSRDLVHWQQLPIALWPDELGTIFSGSAVVDWNNTTGFQTGAEKPLVAAYTYAGEFGKPKQPFTQAIAYSNDRGRTWTKYEHNPVLPNQSGGSDRDPKVFWHEASGKWVMVLYLAEGRRLGFFTSPDLKKWEKTGSEVDDFHECPELFELPVDGNPENTRWVLYGADGEYLIGTFNGKRFKKESGKYRGDYGRNFYASQAYNDVPAEDGRRIQIAWMSGGDYPEMPFNQQMSFPCVLTLRTFPEGIRMCRNPVREIEQLRAEEFSLSNKALKPGANPLEGITGDLFDISVEIDLGKATEVGLRLHRNTITYYTNDHMITCLDAAAPLAPVNNTIKLRVLVDRTTIELFGNDGRVSLSTCFLPRRTETDLELYARGGSARIISLEVYKLRSAWFPAKE